MPIEFQKKSAVFRDIVGVDEAEGLLEWLQNKPKVRIDLAACQSSSAHGRPGHHRKVA
jgi:hypothetical protein